MSNSKGPKMDPCGTANNISYEGRYGKFTFVLCFLFLIYYEPASVLHEAYYKPCENDTGILSRIQA